MLLVPVMMSLKDFFALLDVWEATFEMRLEAVQQLVTVRRFGRSGYSAELPALEEGEQWEFDSDENAWFAEHKEPWCDFERDKQRERNVFMQALGILRSIREATKAQVAPMLEQKDSAGKPYYTGAQVLLSEVSNARGVLMFYGADPLENHRPVPLPYFNENQRTATPWDAK